jgi:hypothetical protein
MFQAAAAPSQNVPIFDSLSGIRGALIGLVVGAAWVAIMTRPDASPPPALSSLAFMGGLTIVGLAVGTVRRIPEVIGLAIGLLLLSTLAMFLAPRDGRLMLWIVALGGRGLICGLTTGLLFRIC